MPHSETAYAKPKIPLPIIAFIRLNTEKLKRVPRSCDSLKDTCGI